MMDKVTYTELPDKETNPRVTYILKWKHLGSVINHNHTFHETKKLKEYILHLEKIYPSIVYTIYKYKKQ